MITKPKPPPDRNKIKKGKKHCQRLLFRSVFQSSGQGAKEQEEKVHEDAAGKRIGKKGKDQNTVITRLEKKNS